MLTWAQSPFTDVYEETNNNTAFLVPRKQDGQQIRLGKKSYLKCLLHAGGNCTIHLHYQVITVNGVCYCKEKDGNWVGYSGRPHVDRKVGCAGDEKADWAAGLVAEDSAECVKIITWRVCVCVGFCSKITEHRVLVLCNTLLRLWPWSVHSGSVWEKC